MTRAIAAPVAAPPAAARLREDGRAGLVVWAVWLALVAGGLGFVARFGSNVPSWDDWDMVPVLTHEQPVTLEWLWSQHNEHRVPLPRLVFLGLHRLLGVDFRVTMYADVLALGAIAAALTALATRLRGRPAYADVFFPLALLHWGQAANLLWGWQLQFVLSVALASVALLALARAGGRRSLALAGFVVGGAALLLPLCGANGVGLAPALALWPLYVAARLPRTPGGRRSGAAVALAALGGAGLALSALYFVGWERVPYHPRSTGPIATLKTALKFFAIGLGPAVRSVWPLSGLAVVALFALGGFRLLEAWRTRPAERPRGAGLLLFFGAMACLALGLGLGRNGFETRYVTLAVPAWCGLYLTALLYGGPRVGPRMEVALAAAAALALWPNTAFGLAYARDLRDHLAGFERDLAAGTPLPRLVERYGNYLHPHHDIPGEYLPMLRRAGVKGYAALRDGPPLAALPIRLVPAALHQVRWTDSTAHATGDEPWVVFDLGRDVPVAGIRLVYRYRSERSPLPYVGLAWKSGTEPDFAPERFKKYSPTGDRANWERGTWTRIHDSATTVTVWTSDTVRWLRLIPNYAPGELRIGELDLLAPAR